MRKAHGRISLGSVAKRKTELCDITPCSSSSSSRLLYSMALHKSQTDPLNPCLGNFGWLRDGSSPVSLPLSPCLSFSTDCQGWSLRVTYLPPDSFQQFLTGCSDMCLSALITCDTGLAWMLTKFKSTIIKQRGHQESCQAGGWGGGVDCIPPSHPAPPPSDTDAHLCR